MRMYDLIMKKRNGGKLTKDEIYFMINGYTQGKVPDYQMSAMMMAIYFVGMDEEYQMNKKKKYKHCFMIGLSFGKDEEKTFVEKTDDLIHHAKELKADGVDVMMAPDEDFNTFVKKVHNAGLKCAVWTIDHAVVAKRWVDAGVDAITSNCAAKAREWVQNH